eukprot:372118_1
MKPWIDEIKNGIVRIINQLKNTYGIGKLRLSFIGYRDYDDENNNLGEKRIEKLKFTCDIFEFESYIKSIKCIGGGEAAEDVLGGILESISGILWEAPIRILYHICDAPPHGICYHNYFEDIQKQLEQQYINNINDEKKKYINGKNGCRQCKKCKKIIPGCKNKNRQKWSNHQENCYE